MTLHAQETVDTRAVAWKTHRLTSNDRTGKSLYSSASVALWRSLGHRAFRGVPPIPDGHVARVVVHYRQPAGRGQVRDASNLHPITKAIVDGITHGPGGPRASQRSRGLWPDDSARWVVGQDDRLLLPAGSLEVVVQVWTGPPTDH